MKKTLLLLFVLSLSLLANAVIIKGNVTDKKGSVISFATIADKAGNNNTSTSEDGSYFIETESGAHDIECAAIGYKTVTKHIVADKDTVVLNFQLEEQQYTLDEVVITNNSEDPAYAIMRKVIAARKAHADMVHTFETDIYLKGLLRTRSMPKNILGVKITDSVKREMGVDSNGKGILYLLEEVSHYTYKAPSKEYNKVISVRESGNSQGLGFANMPPVTNIYDNNIKILDGISPRGFISPANNNAFFYYRFKFLGSFQDNGKMIDKIQVIPKRKFEPLFSGTVYVVEDEWVFQAVNLTVTSESQMQVLDTLRLEQTYKCLMRDNWVIQSQVLYPALKILGFDIAGNFVTVYQNVKLNETIDNPPFNKRELAGYDSMAQDHKTAYWDSIRPVPLQQEEVQDFIKKDSINTAMQKKIDSLKGKPHFSFKVSDFLIGGAGFSLGNHSLFLNSIINMVDYNTVEGLNIKPNLYYTYQFNKSQKFTASWLNRYGFSNQHYNPLLKLSFSKNDTIQYGRGFSIRLQAGKAVYQLNKNNPITDFMNDAYTLLGGENYMKLYEAKVGKAAFNYSAGNGFAASLDINYEDRTTLYNTTDYTFSKNNTDNITPNQPAELPVFTDNKAFTIDVGLRYQPGWKYVQYPKFKMPVAGNAPIFSLHFIKGIAGVLNSESDFDKWQFDIQHSFRMRMLGNIDYRLATGGFLSKKFVAIPDMMHINGNRTILANPYLYSFELAPYYKYSNTANWYGELHAEWHLGGFITNKIPLFRRLQWYAVASTNTLFINKNDYYSEVSVGLENIGWKMVRFARVDFIAGYESGKSRPDIGFRIGLGDLIWQLIGVGKNEND